MADIDIVPKRRSLSWLWMLVALVIVALVVWSIMGNNEPVRVGFSPAPVLSPTASAAVFQLFSA